MAGRILFLVPARGGSRRLPGKNLAPLAGIPLVGWAIRIARAARLDLAGGPHPIVCSTDDAEIAEVARAWGADVLDRPARLATDEATSLDVTLHAIEALGGDDAFEAVVLLQPTSPLTDPADVVAAIYSFRADTRSVTSVVRTHPASWHRALDEEQRLEAPFVQADSAYVLTGAIYVVDPAGLRRAGRFLEPGRTIGHVVPAERSVDIDEASDLAAARARIAARPGRDVAIAGRRLGRGRTLVIAEVGVNHDGDAGKAHRLIDAVAETGADVVKFQTFDPGALAAADAPRAAYQEAGTGAAGDQRSMLEALTLPLDAWAGLREHAEERGLVFLSTPFDDGSAELLDRLGVAAFKLGSGELTNLPFLARMARRGRPLLVSTGMADMLDVAAAVDTIEAAGGPPLVLLHCVSSYPATIEDANLRAIETLGMAFGWPVGWSDHTTDALSAYAAVALGAAVVEKHITLDRSGPGPDHAASTEPQAFGAMVRGIRAIESSLGSGDKVPTTAEAAIAAVARRSLHWARDLAGGSAIREDDLVALRPGTGIRPARLSQFVGRRTSQPVRAGSALRPGDVEGLA